MKQKPTVEEILKEVQSFNDNDNLQAVARERAKPALDLAYAEIFLELVEEEVEKQHLFEEQYTTLRAAIKERLGGR